MTTATAEREIHNHWNCEGNCSRLPLTLADKELIRNAGVLMEDADGSRWCGDCLADLPGSQYDALSHACGEPAAEVALAAAVVPEPEPAVTVRVPRAGDVVWYHGDLTGFHGTYEVVWCRRGRLRLFDGFTVALANVDPSDVTAGGRVKRRRGRKAA